MKEIINGHQPAGKLDASNPHKGSFPDIKWELKNLDSLKEYIFDELIIEHKNTNDINEAINIYAERYHEMKLKLLGLFDIKSLPGNKDMRKYLDTLPYYGTCTTEYNEGFEDGVKWITEKITNNLNNNAIHSNRQKNEH